MTSLERFLLPSLRPKANARTAGPGGVDWGFADPFFCVNDGRMILKDACATAILLF